MNRKGFTLVELLAVMVILIGISMVAVSGISSSLSKRQDNETKEQHELAVSAAKIYFSQTDNITCVKISTLKSQKYIIDNNKTNQLNGADCVAIETTGGSLNYNYKTSACPTPCN